MSWILIAIVAGSIVTSGHDTKEACLGRVATLAELKITAKCVEAPTNYGSSLTGTLLCGGNGCGNIGVH